MTKIDDLEKENIIFFDGVCNLCNGFIDFLIKRDEKKIFRYAPLQGYTATERLPMIRVKLSSVVYLKNGRMLLKSDAAIEVLSDLSGVWRLVSVLKVIPKPIRDAVYSFVASNRYKWFGKKETCRLPSKEERKLFLS